MIAFYTHQGSLQPKFNIWEVQVIFIDYCLFNYNQILPQGLYKLNFYVNICCSLSADLLNTVNGVGFVLTPTVNAKSVISHMFFSCLNKFIIFCFTWVCLVWSLDCKLIASLDILCFWKLLIPTYLRVQVLKNHRVFGYFCVCLFVIVCYSKFFCYHLEINRSWVF